MNPLILPFTLSCSSRRYQQEKRQVSNWNHVCSLFIRLKLSFWHLNPRKETLSLSGSAFFSGLITEYSLPPLGTMKLHQRTNQRGRSGSSSTNERQRKARDTENMKIYYSNFFLTIGKKEIQKYELKEHIKHNDYNVIMWIKIQTIGRTIRDWILLIRGGTGFQKER